jgi:Mn-dependent DtxR family transcriptional regulator
MVACLRRLGPATTSDIARAVSVSPSSALRMLRRLERDGQVARVGRGRATRYHLDDD